MQYILTNADFEALIIWVVKAAVYAVIAAGLLYWLRRELTPRWLLSIVESEKVASARLIAASATVAFNLCMQAAGRISHEMALLNWEAAFGLFMLGPVKIVGKAIADRPAAPTNIKTESVDASAAGDLNLKSEKTTVTQKATEKTGAPPAEAE